MVVWIGPKESSQVRLPRKQTLKQRLACRKFTMKCLWDRHLWDSKEAGLGRRRSWPVRQGQQRLLWIPWVALELGCSFRLVLSWEEGTIVSCPWPLFAYGHPLGKRSGLWMRQLPLVVSNPWGRIELWALSSQNSCNHGNECLGRKGGSGQCNTHPLEGYSRSWFVRGNMLLMNRPKSYILFMKKTSYWGQEISKVCITCQGV